MIEDIDWLVRPRLLVKETEHSLPHHHDVKVSAFKIKILAATKAPNLFLQTQNVKLWETSDLVKLSAMNELTTRASTTAAEKVTYFMETRNELVVLIRNGPVRRQSANVRRKLLHSYLVRC